MTHMTPTEATLRVAAINRCIASLATQAALGTYSWDSVKGDIIRFALAIREIDLTQERLAFYNGGGLKS